MMKKYPLIGVSIVVVVLILASLSNVVGFQTVQSTIKKIINDEVNQKELLFQTIIDIVNNKKIQQTILKSQINRDGFLNPDMKLSLINTPVLTKNQLNHMYIVGLMLSKIISKSRIHSMIERYKVSNQEMQKEITAVIEKDAILNGKMTQLSNSECDCGNENTTRWNFPVLCILLIPLVMLSVVLFLKLHSTFLVTIMGVIGSVLNCSWY
jgi:hypothetical protein